ncbi:MAG: hypothetical protein KGI72_00740 [Patescibacteria group bacterium]|nr:hypothetical protein [Patescibacteria group bacterium]
MIEELLSQYIKKTLSPERKERENVSARYEQLQKIFGDSAEIFQIGSYVRFTAIKPIHDLDVVWVLPDEVRIKKAINPENFTASGVLEELAQQLENEYKKIGERPSIEAQTHSVVIRFGKNLDFSIDVVPAFKTKEKNEFGSFIYLVPEGDPVRWIKSDPLGYIEVAKKLNEKNNSFRKITKFVKGWEKSRRKNYPLIELKSFHLENIVSDLLQKNPDLNCYEGIKKFYQSLSAYLIPQLRDRADGTRFIDDYLKDIDAFDKREIAELALLAQRTISEIESSSEKEDVIKLSERLADASDFGEEFIQKQGIAFVHKKDLLKLRVDGRVTGEERKRGSFREYLLKNAENRVRGLGRKIHYYLSNPRNIPDGAVLKWKVKNRISDYAKEHPRGEISNHATKNDPEVTAFRGQHYVDCYLVKDSKVLGIGRQYLIIEL